MTPSPVAVQHALDRLVVGRRRIFGWGWAAHPTQSVTRVHLRASGEGWEKRIRGDTGLSRDDVGLAFPAFPGAATSGFVVTGYIESETPSRFALEFELADGTSTAVDVSAHAEPAARSARSRQEHGNVALTPHQTVPETDPQAVIDNEITSLKMGVFNLGFVGVANTPEGHRFADWWAARTYRYCRADVPNGLFTDQKWINFAPIFFQGVEIVREPRHNVATWNLTTRSMTGSAAQGFEVDGAPLGFYHFTGFDSGAHRIMAIRNAPGNAAVHELIAWYKRETSPGREDPVSRTPWAFATFDDGTPIRREHRMLYRDYQDLPKAFRDPYSTRGASMSFLEWCDTEGRVRFPHYFTPDPVRSLSAENGIPPGMALRLAALLFAPRGGRLLRQRVGRVLRHEGVSGIARRVKRSLRASS